MKKWYLLAAVLLVVIISSYLNKAVTAVSEQELRDKFQTKLAETGGDIDLPDFRDPKNFPWRDTVRQMILDALGINDTGSVDWSVPADDKIIIYIRDDNTVSISPPGGQTEDPTTYCHWHQLNINNQVQTKVIATLNDQTYYGLGNCGDTYFTLPTGITLDPGDTISIDLYYYWWGTKIARTYQYIHQ